VHVLTRPKCQIFCNLAPPRFEISFTTSTPSTHHQSAQNMSKGKSSCQARYLDSDRIVESCGAVLFDLADPHDKKVCIVRSTYNQEWVLAKGRKNYGEERKDAAIREVMEETGFRCKLFPCTMPTRATPPDAPADFPDRRRIYENLTEAFSYTVIEMSRPKRTKFIYWYIAVLDEQEGADKLPGEERYKPEFLDCRKALETLTYETDRRVLAKAMTVVDDTLFGTPLLGIPLDDVEPVTKSTYAVPHKRKKNSQELGGTTTEASLSRSPKWYKKQKAEKRVAAAELAQEQIATAYNDLAGPK
jgi:8-oxo-dGTP pyrophosphatase MutT (NUDIX family)